MNYSKNILYADCTWNPVTGCSLYSPGCANCFIFKKIKWQKSRGLIRYQNGRIPTCHKELLTQPWYVQKKKRIYISSMGDLFHEKIPTQFIKAVMTVVKHCPQHQFMVTTKRTHRLVEIMGEVEFPDNLWVGASIESNEFLTRMYDIAFIPAENKFVAFEPLIGKINHVDFTGFKWVIVAGESGREARKLPLKTVRYIRDVAVKQGKPFFFKQWDAKNKKTYGRTLDGVVWDQFPTGY